MKESILGALVVGLIIGVACEWLFSAGFFTAIIVMLILGIVGGLANDSNTTTSTTPTSTNLLVEESTGGFEQQAVKDSAGGLEKDNSAWFLVSEGEETTIRFECSEFRTLISSPVARMVRFEVKDRDLFFSYDRLQQYTPIQVAANGGTEWWWFRGSVYKVGFAEGRPSADLAAAIEGVDMKISLSINPVAEQGYSADEVAEGVFEMEGKVETALEYADRMDTVHDTIVQTKEVLEQDHLVSKDDTPHEYGLQKDGSANVFTRKSASTTQVVIQSDAHGSEHVLASDPTVFELASQLQNYHPVLLDKRVGKGRYWKSEVVAEWWWFGNDIYVAKREKGYLSEALAALKKNADFMNVHGKAESWIPKYTVGSEVNDSRYEEGYAPDEIVRLVFASQGREESLEAMFDRVQAAKTLISQNPNLHEPWDETYAAFNHEELREYVQERKGFVDEVTGGHWNEYKQWQRRRGEAFAFEKESLLSETGDDHDDGDKAPSREPIRKSVKLYIWQRDQGRCVSCGSNEKLEYDHIIPLSKGGSNTDRNIQLLCERCNRSKGASIT